MYKCVGSLQVLYEPLLTVREHYQAGEYKAAFGQLEKTLVGVQLVLTQCFDVLLPVVSYEREAFGKCVARGAKLVSGLQNSLAEVQSGEKNLQQAFSEVFFAHVAEVLSLRSECTQAFESLSVVYLDELS